MLTLPGGSKLFTYAGGYTGVIAQYQTQQARIDGVLQAMHDSGQRALGLVLQCASPLPGKSRGASDGLTLPSDDYTWFTNVDALIKRARDIGFEFVAPEFVYMVGDDAMRNWSEFDSAAAARIWDLLANFRDRVMAPCGLPYRIDLGGEWPTKPGPQIQLAQYCWTNYTAAFWPGGVPCQDATISIAAGPASVPLLVECFCGNPPDTLDIHVYAGGDQYPDACSCIVGMKRELEAAGLALPWDIGETNYNHATTAQSTRDGILATRQTVRRVYQWQSYPGADGSNTLVAAPTQYKAWADIGC